MELLKQLDLTELIKRALAEDVGQGDITTAATVAPGTMGRARITVKEPRMILAGGMMIEPVLRLAGADRDRCARARRRRTERGAVAAEIEGKLAGLLIGERIALNFVQLMSGIATTTRATSMRSPARVRRSSTRARRIPACASSRSMRCASAAGTTIAWASTAAC